MKNQILLRKIRILSNEVENIKKQQNILHYKGQGKKIMSLVVLLLILFLTTFCSANLGTFKQNECMQIVTVLNSSNVNLSGVTTPSPSPEILYTDEVMTKDGNFFNFTFCNTSKVGTYTYGYCDSSGICYNNDFEINPSGSKDLGSGSGLSFIGSLLVMLIIAIVFLFVGLSNENVAGKIIFISVSVIAFFMTILFVVVSAQQNLYGYPGLVTGAETFLFIFKILVGIGILALFIIIGLIAKKAWKMKRGYD